MTADRWLAAAQEGDAAAFNHLVAHFQATAYQVAFYHTANADDALDACQEAMLSAWRALPRFEGDVDGFRAWLLRIVVNACRDRIRYERRRPHGPIEVERDGELRALPLPAHGQTPEEYAENNDLRALLEACLARLSDDHRTVILLDQSGLSYPEIADTLDIEVGTVKSRLSRARAAMRELLTSEGHPTGVEPQPEPRRSDRDGDGRGVTGETPDPTAAGDRRGRDAGRSSETDAP